MAKKRHHSSKKHHSSDHSAMHHSSSKENHGGHMDPEHYRAERRGMEHAMYRHEGRQVAGTDPRRTWEMEDAGMIRENPHAIANLPQEVMIKPYPMTGPYNPEMLDDTIAGVDHQMDYDDSKRAQNFYPKKV